MTNKATPIPIRKYVEQYKQAKHTAGANFGPTFVGPIEPIPAEERGLNLRKITLGVGEAASYPFQVGKNDTKDSFGFFKFVNEINTGFVARSATITTEPNGKGEVLGRYGLTSGNTTSRDPGRMTGTDEPFGRYREDLPGEKFETIDKPAGTQLYLNFWLDDEHASGPVVFGHQAN